MAARRHHGHEGHVGHAAAGLGVPLGDPGAGVTFAVAQVVPGKRPTWGCPAQGITAVHVWTFTPTKKAVLVHTGEPWIGAPVDADADTANRQAALDTSLHAWVNNLKRGNESHA
ncbi:hypothetical protein [Streptomyces sp. NPDC058695]|uniref:hypothetical protein n=1 Tax=Streptomyces sp. NPDC058695 TaxID=3346604 RepID=UPI003661CD27